MKAIALAKEIRCDYKISLQLAKLIFFFMFVHIHCDCV